MQDNWGRDETRANVRIEGYRILRSDTLCRRDNVFLVSKCFEKRGNLAERRTLQDLAGESKNKLTLWLPCDVRSRRVFVESSIIDASVFVRSSIITCDTRNHKTIDYQTWMIIYCDFLGMKFLKITNSLLFTFRLTFGDFKLHKFSKFL